MKSKLFIFHSNNPNIKINLSGNINLTKEAKEELKRHFQERVTF